MESAHATAQLPGRRCTTRSEPARRILAARDALDPRPRAAIARDRPTHRALPSFRTPRASLLTLPFRSEWDTRTSMRARCTRQRRGAAARRRRQRMLDCIRVRDIARERGPGYRGIPSRRDRLARRRTRRRLGPGAGVAFDASGRGSATAAATTTACRRCCGARRRVAGAFELQIVERSARSAARPA
jgi:hypothetical protein